MVAIIFALISYVGWGTGVFAEAIVARKLPPLSLAFWALSLSVLIMSFYAPFALKDLVSLTPAILILIIILSVIGLFGGLSYYQALNLGNPGLVGTIASSFPAVVVLLSVIFLGERVSIQQMIAIGVIFIGIFLSSFDIRLIRKKTLINKGLLFALLAMLSWGIVYTFIKIPVSKIGWFWPNYISFFIFPLIYFYMRFRKIKLERPTKNSVIFVLIISTILVRVAELTYSLGISKGLVTVVAPIAGANPTLFVILAFLFFKDKITRQQVAGIITTLIGIVLLSIFSV